MQHRKLGRTGLTISEISLGAEHLDNQDRQLVKNVVNHALDHGINYIDPVLYVTPENRDSMGAALRGRRQEAMISAHFGAVYREGKYHKTRDPELCVPSFEDYLKRLHTDYVDVLMLHWIDTDEDSAEAFDENGYLGAALRLKRDGRARCIALSTHIVGIAERAISTGQVDALMFPVNPAHDVLPGDYGLGRMWDAATHDELLRQRPDRGASRAGLYLMCEQEDVGLIAMKPYAGGLLLRSGPMSKHLENQEGLRNPGGLVLSPAQCISYVLKRPGVTTALVGCRSVEQIDAAVAYYEAAEAQRDFSAIDTDELWKLAGRCVYCNHCLPCPEEIPIGDLLRLLDSAEYSSNDETTKAYLNLSKQAEDCTSCEVCMDRCPFGVHVTERMSDAVDVFGR